MANKAMLVKVLEAARGYAEVTNRRPAAQPIGLYLMELRARAARPRPPTPSAHIVADWCTDSDTSWPAEIRQCPAQTEVLTVVVG